MDDFETVEDTLDVLDPIYQKQKEGISRMRMSLFACSENLGAARQAINNITVLRIYHQVARIIKYLEMMDKIEAKMYEAIDYTLDNAKVTSTSTWVLLLELQEKLQKIMIDSHKLLQPYLNLQEYTVMDLSGQTEVSDVPTAVILNAESREKLRNSAQAVLLELNASGDPGDSL